MAALPGWFPDPSGTPGRLRYWDGVRWTPHIADRPPGPPTPRYRWPRPVLGLGVLALLIALLVSTYALSQARRQAPGQQPAAAPASAPSSRSPVGSPPPIRASAPTAHAPAGPECAPVDVGTLSDGHLTVTMPSTWQRQSDAHLDWADCYAVGSRHVTDQWTTVAIVAHIPDKDRSPQTLAESLWEWNVLGNYEGGSSSIRVTGDTVTNRTTTRAFDSFGYKLTGEVTVSGVREVTGDDVAIQVVQHDDGTYTAVMTFSVIDDPASKADVASIWVSARTG